MAGEGRAGGERDDKSTHNTQFKKKLYFLFAWDCLVGSSFPLFSGILHGSSLIAFAFKIGI